MSKTKTTRKAAEGFSVEEKAAMIARARELKANEDGESAVRAAIAKMSPQDRAIAKPLHDLIKDTAPELTTKKDKKEGFSAEEKAAMRARARELKAKEDGESAVRASIAAMSPNDRKLGKRLDSLIKESAPELSPKTWYGMPAYAKDGKVVCFFQSAGKFKSRYATLGFSDNANLDKGAMWPTAFALKELTAAEEKKITALVKSAVR